MKTYDTEMPGSRGTRGDSGKPRNSSDLKVQCIEGSESTSTYQQARRHSALITGCSSMEVAGDKNNSNELLGSKSGGGGLKRDWQNTNSCPFEEFCYKLKNDRNCRGIFLTGWENNIFV